MNIEELQRKHQDIYVEDDLKEEFRQHRNLSIQFAIKILESVGEIHDESILSERLRNKIQELKQYLNETV